MPCFGTVTMRLVLDNPEVARALIELKQAAEELHDDLPWRDDARDIMRLTEKLLKNVSAKHIPRRNS
jgi:hypothetical protein